MFSLTMFKGLCVWCCYGLVHAAGFQPVARVRNVRILLMILLW